MSESKSPWSLGDTLTESRTRKSSEDDMATVLKMIPRDVVMDGLRELMFVQDLLLSEAVFSAP